MGTSYSKSLIKLLLGIDILQVRLPFFFLWTLLDVICGVCPSISGWSTQGRVSLMGVFGFAAVYHSPVAEMHLVGQCLCLWTELINPIHFKVSFIPLACFLFGKVSSGVPWVPFYISTVFISVSFISHLAINLLINFALSSPLFFFILLFFSSCGLYVF